MKDLPRLVKDAGNVALRVKKRSAILKKNKRLKEAADTYLAYKFAITPLISDVQNMVNWQNHAERRMEELDKLYSGKGMRRRINVWSDVRETQQGQVPVESGLSIVFTCRVRTVTEGRRWITLRWKPTSKRPFSNDKEKQSLANSLVFGLNAQSLTSTAWNLLPWSWMIDWFTNMGDYIASGNNAVPAQAVSRCVMTHTRTTATWTRDDNHFDFQGGGATFVRESKVRTIGVGASPDANFPLLSGNQLSILGALFAARQGRR